MTNPNYIFIGWLKEGQSDKVWGVIELSCGEKYLTFWGRRGTKYQTKVVDSGRPHPPFFSKFWRGNDLDRKISEKIEKGYRSVEKSELETVYPDFEQDLQQATFWTMMTKSAEVGSASWDKVMKKE